MPALIDEVWEKVISGICVYVCVCLCVCVHLCVLTL